MANTLFSDPNALKAGAQKYLSELPADLICALQMWYEGLGGQGVPNPEEMAAMQDLIASSPGWKDVGPVRYEKFGVQQSYKRIK
jgi:hypothetical protein